MNKLFFIIVYACLLSVNGNCQWYNRRYGVNDINQLSREQLNLALVRAHKGITGGTILSLAGVAGITVGLIMTTNESEDFAKSLSGMALTAVSTFTEVIGLAILIDNSLRTRRIKKALNGTEMKIGLINYQMEQVYTDSQGLSLPCLSVTICF